MGLGCTEEQNRKGLLGSVVELLGADDKPDGTQRAVRYLTTA